MSTLRRVAQSADARLGAIRTGHGFKARQALDGYLFAAPAILGLLIFTAYPIVYTFYLSFTEYNFIDPPDFVGLRNYRKLLGEDQFQKALTLTIYYSALTIPLTMVVGFLVAILMNQKVRGIAFFRTVWYLPSLVPAVAAAALWRWLLNYDFGLLNNVLLDLGLPAPGWLIEPRWTIPVLASVSLWTGLGGVMLIFLAGLQGVPAHLYEAAHLDGANAWQRFRQVTIPMMSPVIFFNLILNIIGSFQAFTIIYLIYTPSGGSGSVGPSDSAMLYLVYLYRTGFQYFRVGDAAALSWVLFLVIVALTLVTFRFQRRWVYYEADVR